MWDESENYLHLLDIFNDLTQYEEQDGDGDNIRIEVEHGPRVIPGHKKGVWMSLRSPNMAFMSLPKSGKGLENPLYNLLTEHYPEIKNVTEVHPVLQNTRNHNSPGRAWRENALAIAMKIHKKI